MKFKRLTSLLLALLLLLLGFAETACAAENGIFEGSALNESLTTENNPKSLKLLAIGNSFSDDAVKYLYSLAKNAGAKNVVIASMDVPGCDLKIHRANAQSDLPIYKYTKCGKSTGGKTKVFTNISILSALKDENWDYITLQQSSAMSGIMKSYNGDLDFLVKYIMKNRPLKTTKLCWHMTWAYAKNYREDKFESYHFNQSEMYRAICRVIKNKIEPDSRIEVMIPVGTAIQNLRTSYIGDRLNRDGRHLNEIGRYTAALTFMKSLGFSIDGVSWLPKSKSLCSAYLPAIKAAVNDAAAVPLSISDEGNVCNHSTGKNVAYKTVVEKKGYPATCISEGLSDGLYCKVCKSFVKPQTVIPINSNHKFKFNVIRPASVKANGEMTAVCSVCKAFEKIEIEAIKTVALSKSEYRYTGEPMELSFSVTDSAGKKLKAGTDFTVTYGANGRTEPGKHTAKLNFKNKYSGKAELEFTVTPKKTEFKKLKAKSGGFYAEWKAVRQGADGYIVEYAKTPDFSGKTLKRVKVKSAAVTERFFAENESGVYFVRIRTFSVCKSGVVLSPPGKVKKIRIQ